MNKLNRVIVASAMRSSIENYAFEIIDSVENEAGNLTAEEQCALNQWVRDAVEKAASAVETGGEA